MDDICALCCGALCAISCLACCCDLKDKNNRHDPYAGTPVTVTTQHVTTSAVVQPPYPVGARHPMPQPVPQPMAHQPGFISQGGYQGGAYPPGPVTGYYYPPPMGGPGVSPYPPGNAPYPTGNTPYPPSNTPYPPVTPYPPGQSAPPPSYHEAVGHPQAQPPPMVEQYAKQSPYNPNY